MSKVNDLSARRANLSADQLALLAKRLRGGAGAAPSRPAMPRRDSGAPAVLSFAQQRLWYLWKLDPDSAAYNLAGGLRLRNGVIHQFFEFAIAFTQHTAVGFMGLWRAENFPVCRFLGFSTFTGQQSIIHHKGYSTAAFQRTE